MAKRPIRTSDADSNLVIVEREFELRSEGLESKVFVRFRRPVSLEARPQEFQCEFEIEGLEAPIAEHGSGVDVIQAYEMASHGAALRLLSSREYQSGRLTFRGSYDLRLPFPESQSCLVRTDLERERVVRELAGKDELSKRFSAGMIARLKDTSKIWPDLPEDAPIVLERVFDLRRGRKRTDVRVFFRKPVPHRQGYWCAFKIERLLKKPQAITMMLGHDPIDSLGHAMQLAMTYILMSPEYRRGQLTWWTMYDLGLPVRDDIAPLIRRDLNAKVLAKGYTTPRRRGGSRA